MTKQPYPLRWPDGWPRTDQPKRAAFLTKSIFDARIELATELRRLGAKDIEITSNAEITKSGEIASRQRYLSDPGVAVYFTLNGATRCIPCDRWDNLADNLHAIALSVDAIRGLARWGAKQMVETAFAGFAALPPSTSDEPRYWWDVLGVDQNASRAEIDAAYRRRVKETHPDGGGSDNDFIELTEAYSVAKQVQEFVR